MHVTWEHLFDWISPSEDQYPFPEEQVPWWLQLVLGCLLFTLTGLLVSLLKKFRFVTSRRLRKISFWFYVVCFCSLVYEYMRLYLERSGIRCARLKKHGDNCFQRGLINWLRTTVNGFFKWGDMDCEKYFEAVYVSPFFDVSPFEVIIGAICRPLTCLFRIISINIIGCICIIMAHTPPFYQPFVFLILAVMCILFPFIIFGYELHSPVMRLCHNQRLTSQASKRFNKLSK